jgi:hypothetical protein
MISHVYEVHDEDGCLRVFFTLVEATRFAGHDYKIVKIKEEKPRRPKFNIDDFEPALF